MIECSVKRALEFSELDKDWNISVSVWSKTREHQELFSFLLTLCWNCPPVANNMLSLKTCKHVPVDFFFLFCQLVSFSTPFFFCMLVSQGCSGAAATPAGRGGHHNATLPLQQFQLKGKPSMLTAPSVVLQNLSSWPVKVLHTES